MDFDLSAEQREIQALAREFAEAEIEPHAAEWDREHRFPREVVDKLAELGLMGVCVPEARLARVACARVDPVEPDWLVATPHSRTPLGASIETP